MSPEGLARSQPQFFVEGSKRSVFWGGGNDKDTNVGGEAAYFVK